MKKKTLAKVKTIQSLDSMLSVMIAGLDKAMVNVKRSVLSDRKVKVTVMKLIVFNVTKLNNHYGVKVEKGHGYFKESLDKQGLGSYSLFKKYRALINMPDELAKYLNGERDLNPPKSDTENTDVKSTDEILKSINKKIANIQKLVKEQLPDYTVSVKDNIIVVEKIEKLSKKTPYKNDTISKFNAIARELNTN